MDHQSSNESSFEETLSFEEFIIEDICVEDTCAVPLQYEENDKFGFSDRYIKCKTDKPYMCSKCNKGFACTYSMKRHQRTVCGKIRNTNGQFKCKCGRSYPNKGNLKRHVVNECGVERRFWCCFCLKRFTQNSSRIRHLRKFHKDQYEKFLTGNSSIASLANAHDVTKMKKKMRYCSF
ncbi:zinc finger protein 787-like [Vespula maculifrons]|uniref:Zinc finger protein 787-like n=1 Tax=Vespula maculifrons TaxID=7453 RepID=A0ABD2C0F8_VESMC